MVDIFYLKLEIPESLAKRLADKGLTDHPIHHGRSTTYFPVELTREEIVKYLSVLVQKN